jgi:hypothetical protein
MPGTISPGRVSDWKGLAAQPIFITYLYGKRYQKNSCKKRRILLLLSVQVFRGMGIDW